MHDLLIEKQKKQSQTQLTFCIDQRKQCNIDYDIITVQATSVTLTRLLGATIIALSIIGRPSGL